MAGDKVSRVAAVWKSMSEQAAQSLLVFTGVQQDEGK